jgi:hemolysin III
MLSLVALYAASTLSHSFEAPERRDFYRMLDQVCIFLLVAGTYTPFGLVHARDGGWWVLLAAMWLCALCGISVRIRGRRSVPAVFYVVLGWLPLLAMGRAAEVGEWWGMTLVIAGGLAYTCGTWFLANDRRHPYFHAVWHLCTIAGSACHYLFLLQYVAMERA